MSSLAFSALGRSQSVFMFKEASCLVEIEKDSGEVFCSANHIGDGFFKTAAHCFEGGKSVKLFCDGSPGLEVNLPQIHPQFSAQREGYKRGERLFDLALLDTRGIMANRPFGRIPRSWQKTRNIILSADFCFFTGYGINEENQRLGFYKETLVPSTGLEQNVQYLIYNNFLQFTVMAGDSGGSLYCVINDQVFDIGSSSGKDFSQRSLMISSYKALDVFKLEQGSVTHSLESQPASPFLESKIKIGETYRVKTFSLLYGLNDESKVYGNGDNWKVYFEVRSIQGEYASGTFLNEGVSIFYLCIDGMICSSEGEAKIRLQDLISE